MTWEIALYEGIHIYGSRFCSGFHLLCLIYAIYRYDLLLCLEVQVVRNLFFHQNSRVLFVRSLLIDCLVHLQYLKFNLKLTIFIKL